jgi:cellulose biosynthesis protein BcsQ
MKTVAIYNTKGGVGKTTTAVNLSYLAAHSGLRILLWDLDPQGASTFAFRIQPHVSGLEKRSFENGHALRAAIKQTDYDNLYLLPADFAYHKLDRWLGSLGDPGRLLTSLLATISHDFDIVILDCPAGFSRLTEAILAAADAIVSPTIPNLLSLRMLALLVGQAERSGSRSSMVAVLNMVDRRKTLHRRACELAAEQAEIFLPVEIPYASAVEQMAARRMPTPVFAPQAPAARAFAGIWAELEARLRRDGDNRAERRWALILRGLETLIEQLDATERPLCVPGIAAAHDHASVDVVHRFDSERRDLEHRGYALELRERAGGEFIVVARSDEDRRAEARIDRSWTIQILAGQLSPLEALERRIGPPPPHAIAHIRAAVNGRHLRRVETGQLETLASVRPGAGDPGL